MSAAVQARPSVPQTTSSHAIPTSSSQTAPKREKVLGYTVDVSNLKMKNSDQKIATLCVGAMIVGKGGVTQEEANKLLQQGKGAMLILQDKKLQTVIVSPGVYKDLLTANILKDQGSEKMARISQRGLGDNAITLFSEPVKVLSYTDEQYRQLVLQFSK